MICEFSVNFCEVFVNKKDYYFQLKKVNLHHENQKVKV